MSQTETNALRDIKARDAEIRALRNAGWQLSAIALRFKLTTEGVRYIINGKPGSNANKILREQAYARLEAVDGVALIKAGMSIRRLASVADTNPRRVEQWLQLNGITKYC